MRGGKVGEPRRIFVSAAAAAAAPVAPDWRRQKRSPGHCVVIRPLLVATIQRLPQRTIESILPKPGTVLPRVTFRVPLGPSRTAVPPTTSWTFQPGMVVGRFSGVGTGFGPGKFFDFCGAAAPGGPAAARFSRATFAAGFVGTP